MNLDSCHRRARAMAMVAGLATGACTLEHILGASPEDEGDGSDTEEPVASTGAGGGVAPGEGDVSTAPSTFVRGGIGSTEYWEGYTFATASADSDISPEEFLGSDLCVTGFLGTSGEAWAAIGWHIAQEIDPQTFEAGAVGAVVPDGGALRVVLSNEGASRLRIQIQTVEGAGKSWCFETSESETVIPWSDFHEGCSVSDGSAYDGQTPISTILVETYSDSTSERTPFDFCVVELALAR